MRLPSSAEEGKVGCGLLLDRMGQVEEGHLRQRGPFGLASRFICLISSAGVGYFDACVEAGVVVAAAQGSLVQLVERLVAVPCRESAAPSAKVHATAATAIPIRTRIKFYR